jgi:hypothetical protein
MTKFEKINDVLERYAQPAMSRELYDSDAVSVYDRGTDDNYELLMICTEGVNGDWFVIYNNGNGNCGVVAEQDDDVQAYIQAFVDEAESE